MIIEAGYDLRELLLPILLGDNAAGKRPLVLVGMNADLRLLFVTRVTDDMEDDVTGYTDQVFDFLVSKRRDIESLIPYYFAVAHMVPGNKGGLEYHFHHDELDLAAKERGFHFIGEQVFDDEYWQSSGPMYSFEDYGMDELPRALVYRGPHPFECECPPCSAKRNRLAEGRRRAMGDS